MSPHVLRNASIISRPIRTAVDRTRVGLQSLMDGCDVVLQSLLVYHPFVTSGPRTGEPGTGLVMVSVLLHETRIVCLVLTSGPFADQRWSQFVCRLLMHFETALCDISFAAEVAHEWPLIGVNPLLVKV